MIVAVLISIMIAVVVGVNLIPMITETISSNITQDAAGETTAIGSLIGILPYIFIAVLILGAVAWMGYSPFGDSDEKEERREKVKQFFGNAREVILRIEYSSKNWEQYINNLDALLGIETIVVKCQGEDPCKTREGEPFCGLLLSPNRKLWIDKSYDWYITDKHPDWDVFKIVGLHKKDADLNLVYLLGASEETGEPYLTEVPDANRFLEASCKSCYNWVISYRVVATT